MAKPFFPTRWWEWTLALLCLLLLYAVFAPVYTYSGPGISPGRVASDLANHHRETGGWARDEREFPLRRVPPHHSYRYELRGTTPHAALYRIAVDGKEEMWRVGDDRQPVRLQVE